MKKLVLLLLLSASGQLSAQNFAFNFNTNGRRVCLVTSEVDLNVPSVTVKLLDAAANTTTTTDIYRRPLYGTGADWVSVATALPAGTTQWTDLNVNAGEAWEYQVKRNDTWTYSAQTYDATGYTIGSLLKDKSNYQGQMILLVADNIASGLPAKYLRLKKELTGEGWFVNELIVPDAYDWYSGDTIIGIRAQVAAMYNAAPSNDKPKTLFILGHVPMPRSGSTAVTAPDGHDQNKGARGCDGYYADIDGIYTDLATFNPGGLQTPLAINLPGDFKWDQDFFPSALEMAFGRVDFRDLINTPLSELQMTENYLDNLSSYRTVAAGFDMGNKTAFYSGYDNSNDGSYRTLPNLSKAADVYQNTVGAPHPQWVQQNGPFKVYMQNTTFPDVSEWQTYGMNATVYSSDQSYWGFNDVPQDFYYSRIRALLGADTKCLVTLWTTSAVNMFYQACSGDPLGQAVKEIMNNNTINNNIEKPQQNWDASDWWNRTHFAYNGDPTLRLDQVEPPSNLSIANVNNSALLSWTASPDATVSGYHLYKSSTEFGIYERITTSPVTALTYTDAGFQHNYWYMLRAVKTEETGCGKFIAPSMGIFILGDLPLSVAEHTLTGKLTLYPNPADKALSVETDYMIDALRIVAFDGRTVVSLNDLHTSSVKLDVSFLTPGIYFVQTSGGGKSGIEKVVVR